MQRRVSTKFIQDYARELDNYSEDIAQDISNTIAQNLQDRYGDKYKISVGDKFVTISNGSEGPIDLKEGFKRSASAKTKKGGGWYLVVPIRRKKMSMHHSTYTFARGLDMGSTANAPRLFEGRGGRQYNQFNPNKQNRSNNLTRGRNPITGQSQYVAYRTVSDKSPADSWIINRNMDRGTLLEDVRELVSDLTEYRLNIITSKK